jgi:stage V sporulation protein SpoVS
MIDPSAPTELESEMSEMKALDESVTIDGHFKPQNEDPGFLVAKGRFHAKDAEERDLKEKDHRSKLANAIYMAIVNHGYAHIRAIGTAAIANAVRAITLATERCKKKNISLMWDTVVDKGNLGPMRQANHVKDVTAYSFRIKQWVDLEAQDG